MQGIATAICTLCIKEDDNLVEDIAIDPGESHESRVMVDEWHLVLVIVEQVRVPADTDKPRAGLGQARPDDANWSARVSCLFTHGVSLRFRPAAPQPLFSSLSTHAVTAVNSLASTRYTVHTHTSITRAPRHERTTAANRQAEVVYAALPDLSYETADVTGASTVELTFQWSCQWLRARRTAP